ncbi:MAG: hypothetical protein QM734_13585 [Cyclobacteriaceae bacterium]
MMGILLIPKKVAVNNPLDVTSMTVFPNPAKETDNISLRIKNPNSTYMQISIAHISGRVVFSGAFTLDADHEREIGNLARSYSFTRWNVSG